MTFIDAMHEFARLDHAARQAAAAGRDRIRFEVTVTLALAARERLIDVTPVELLAYAATGRAS